MSNYNQIIRITWNLSINFTRFVHSWNRIRFDATFFTLRNGFFLAIAISNIFTSRIKHVNYLFCIAFSESIFEILFGETLIKFSFKILLPFICFLFLNVLRPQSKNQRKRKERQVLGPSLRIKKAIEHESNGDINCIWWLERSLKGLERRLEELGIKDESRPSKIWHC